jgi:hypothetical protein
MQAENQKLKKEIVDKVNKIQMMERQFEDTSRETKKMTDVISLYSSILGIHIDPVHGRDKEYLISIYDKIDSSKKIFEAKIQSISVMRDMPEWQVVLNKLPLNPFLGFAIGDKLIYQESNISSFFEMVKEAALLS